MLPNVKMRAIRTAPVATVFAKRARAMFPPESRSAMMPEPTTVATRNAVPTNSAMARLIKGYLGHGKTSSHKAELAVKSNIKRTTAIVCGWMVGNSEAGTLTPMQAMIGSPSTANRTVETAMSPATFVGAFEMITEP